MPPQQLDLFSDAGFRPERRPDAWVGRPLLVASRLDDAGLIRAIPDASLRDCRDLAAEAERRCLVAAVPALEALCRRFKGFGTDHPVAEQTAALGGLAAIGGREAADAVARIVTDRVMQGPGLAQAVAAAARLGARVPRSVVASLLRDPSPDIRADACRFSNPWPEVIALLGDLLGDLNAPVSAAAACALGRMGRVESRPVLMRLLFEQSSAEVIEAIAAVADEACLILLGRLARSRPELAGKVMAVLEDADSPRAATVAAAIRRGQEADARAGRETAG